MNFDLNLFDSPSWFDFDKTLNWAADAGSFEFKGRSFLHFASYKLLVGARTPSKSRQSPDLSFASSHRATK